MKQLIGNDWDERLQHVFASSSYEALRQFLKEEYATTTIFPDMHDIWTALKCTPFSETKVVILGQDPYYRPNQAHGMSFSVKPGVALPPSLRNMFKELATDLQVDVPTEGTLTGWATQGVLLLNAVLTVREGEPNSHKGKGWEVVTDEVIRQLNNKDERVVFILWGNEAKKKKALIDQSKHVIIEGVHPSPLSAHRGFFGSRPYTRTNEALQEAGLTPIDWKKVSIGWPIP